MTLAATSYFEHLKAYVNSDYVAHDGTDGKVVLSEKYFRPQDVKPQTRKVELLLPSGGGLAFKLDLDDVDASKKIPRLYPFGRNTIRRRFESEVNSAGNTAQIA